MNRKTIVSDNLFLFFPAFFSFIALPFSFTSNAIDPTLHLGFIIWSFLTLLLYIFFLNKEREQKLPFAFMAQRKIFWVTGVFLFMAAFSLTRSVNIGEGIFVWLTIFLSVAFLFICSIFFCWRPNSLIFLNQWAVIAGIGLVFLGLTGHYWNNDSAVFNTFFLKGIMINKNLYASSLFLFIPFIIHCLISEQKKWRITAAVLLPVFCIVILLSYSMAVWLAMILSGVPVIILVFYFSFKHHHDKNTAKKKMLLIASIISLIWACLFIFQSLGNKETIQIRLTLWTSTIKMIQDNAFFGVGPGQWRLVFPKYAEPLSTDWNSINNIKTNAQRPHNDFLWFAAETGIIGLICYLLFFGILYYYAVKILDKADHRQKIFILSIIYGISGYLIIAMFSYPSERPLHSILILLIAAVVVSSYHRLYPKIQVNGFSISRIKSIMTILLIVCCLFNCSRLHSEIQLKKALQARARGEWHQVIAHIDKVFLPLYSIDPFGIPVFWYRGMANYNKGNLSASLIDFTRAVDYHPYHFYSIDNLTIVKQIIKEQKTR